jgi:hypothetical protein
MAQTMNLQLSLDSAHTVEVLIPEGMRDEGLIADLIGTRLKEAGNRFAGQWDRAYHVGHGVFGFQDDAGAEFWLLCVEHGHKAIRVPDSEVFRLTGIVPKDSG